MYLESRPSDRKYSRPQKAVFLATALCLGASLLGWPLALFVFPSAFLFLHDKIGPGSFTGFECIGLLLAALVALSVAVEVYAVFKSRKRNEPT